MRGRGSACADLIEQKTRDKNGGAGKGKDGDGSFNIAEALCEVLTLEFYI